MARWFFSHFAYEFLDYICWSYVNEEPVTRLRAQNMAPFSQLEM